MEILNFYPWELITFSFHRKQMNFEQDTYISVYTPCVDPEGAAPS